LDDELGREVGRSRDLENVGFTFRRLTDSRVFEGQGMRIKGCGKHPERQADEILFHGCHALLRRSEWRPAAPHIRRHRPAGAAARGRRRFLVQVVVAIESDHPR
jgi:hypothetical protein